MLCGVSAYPGIWVCCPPCFAGQIPLHGDDFFSHFIQPEVWELFQEGLSPQFSVAARWHNLLPLPPSEVAVALSSQTELEASGSKAKEMEKIGKEVRMQIPGVPPR